MFLECCLMLQRLILSQPSHTAHRESLQSVGCDEQEKQSLPSIQMNAMSHRDQCRLPWRGRRRKLQGCQNPPHETSLRRSSLQGSNSKRPRLLSCGQDLNKATPLRRVRTQQNQQRRPREAVVNGITCLTCQQRHLPWHQLQEAAG